MSHEMIIDLMRGGEAFIVDAECRVHEIALDADGKVTLHRRYDGNPDDVVPELVEAFAQAREPEFDYVDML